MAGSVHITILTTAGSIHITVSQEHDMKLFRESKGQSQVSPRCYIPNLLRVWYNVTPNQRPLTKTLSISPSSIFQQPQSTTKDTNLPQFITCPLQPPKYTKNYKATLNRPLSQGFSKRKHPLRYLQRKPRSLTLKNFQHISFHTTNITW